VKIMADKIAINDEASLRSLRVGLVAQQAVDLQIIQQLSQSCSTIFQGVVVFGNFLVGGMLFLLTALASTSVQSRAALDIAKTVKLVLFILFAVVALLLMLISAMQGAESLCSVSCRKHKNHPRQSLNSQTESVKSVNSSYWDRLHSTVCNISAIQVQFAVLSIALAACAIIDTAEADIALLMLFPPAVVSFPVYALKSGAEKLSSAQALQLETLIAPGIQLANELELLKRRLVRLSQEQGCPGGGKDEAFDGACALLHGTHSRHFNSKVKSRPGSPTIEAAGASSALPTMTKAQNPQNGYKSALDSLLSQSSRLHKWARSAAVIARMTCTQPLTLEDILVRTVDAISDSSPGLAHDIQVPTVPPILLATDANVAAVDLMMAVKACTERACTAARLALNAGGRILRVQVGLRLRATGASAGRGLSELHASSPAKSGTKLQLQMYCVLSQYAHCMSERQIARANSSQAITMLGGENGEGDTWTRVRQARQRLRLLKGDVLVVPNSGGYSIIVMLPMDIEASSSDVGSVVAAQAGAVPEQWAQVFAAMKQAKWKQSFRAWLSCRLPPGLCLSHAGKTQVTCAKTRRRFNRQCIDAVWLVPRGKCARRISTTLDVAYSTHSGKNMETTTEENTSTGLPLDVSKSQARYKNLHGSVRSLSSRSLSELCSSSSNSQADALSHRLRRLSTLRVSSLPPVALKLPESPEITATQPAAGNLDLSQSVTRCSVSGLGARALEKEMPPAKLVHEVDIGYAEDGMSRPLNRPTSRGSTGPEGQLQTPFDGLHSSWSSRGGAMKQQFDSAALKHADNRLGSERHTVISARKDLSVMGLSELQLFPLSAEKLVTVGDAEATESDSYTTESCVRSSPPRLGCGGALIVADAKSMMGGVKKANISTKSKASVEQFPVQYGKQHVRKPCHDFNTTATDQMSPVHRDGSSTGSASRLSWDDLDTIPMAMVPSDSVMNATMSRSTSHTAGPRAHSNLSSLAGGTGFPSAHRDDSQIALDDSDSRPSAGDDLSLATRTDMTATAVTLDEDELIHVLNEC
jgi:hypothetical protein